MRSMKQARVWMLASVLALGAAPWAASLAADEVQENHDADRDRYASERGLALSGDAGYYTYGMDDVNSRFNQGGTNDIHGGMGYGGAVKLGLTDNLAARIGVDYLLANRPSSRTIGGVTYDSTVNLPATLLFVGGEFVLLPLRVVNVKLIAGYTLVTIYNGDERTNASNTDLGSVTGSGSGFQAGLGAEFFLARGFSLEGDLAYNYARISNATFAGSAADPNSVNSNGTVDYSGLMAKVAFNIYLFR